jgi:hypothetical protein
MPFRTILLILGLTSLAVAQSSDPSLVWTKPAEIKRVPKPQHKAPPAPHKTVSAPLLTLRWQVLTVGADGKEKAIDPKTFVFHNDDRLRFAVKVNQAGFLYVINHTESLDGKIIDKPRLIFNGHNYVDKEQEVFLPDNCPGLYRDEQGKCWYKMTPPGGHQIVTVVFSREQIENLPNEAPEAGVEVDPAIINDLRSSSPKPSHRPWAATAAPGSVLKGAFITAAWNPNKDDNEDLVEQIVLTHEEQRRK